MRYFHPLLLVRFTIVVVLVELGDATRTSPCVTMRHAVTKCQICNLFKLRLEVFFRGETKSYSILCARLSKFKLLNLYSR